MVPDGSMGSFAGPVQRNASGKHTATGDGDTIEVSAARAERLAELAQLEREIVTAAAHIAAATHRLLTALREFDERRGWEAYGRKSTADWLSWRAGMSLGLAREKVRVARSLGRVPRIDAALQNAEISFSKARALTRVATPENEDALLVTAANSTAHQLERACRRLRYVALDQVEGRGALARTEGRYVHFRDGDFGYVQIVIQLPPEEAAEVRATLEASGSQARKLARAAKRAAALLETETAADAAEAPEPAADDLEPGEAADQRSTFSQADAFLAVCRAFIATPAFASGRRPRCEVFVEVAQATLDGSGGAPAHLADGTALCPQTAQRLTCDNAIVPVTKDGAGNLLDVGRRTRTVPSPIARALQLRDQRCRFPGCANHISLDAHHVVHWARGGETKVENLVLLCDHHHWCVHEGGYSAGDEEGQLVFRDPRGRVIVNAPPLSPDGDARADLLAWLQDHGPDPRNAMPVPVGDGRAEWATFVVSLLARTYGKEPEVAGLRMPMPDGEPPTTEEPHAEAA